ncbi:F0F1 ATP synthase subunit A [bacterium]|nr:F0F1 ATP synthase subunit A [bacterium]
MHELEAKIFYLLGFIPASPGVVLPWVITGVLGLICFFLTRKTSLIPSSHQNVLEWIVEELAKFLESLLGHKHSRELIPFFSTIFIYILTSNLLGIIPGLKSPTSIFSNCLGMALIIFIMTHYLGLKHGGFGYIKHFWGEPVWLGPLMFPIHIIGELARPISLTLRLFGNIMGEDVVILVLTIYIFPFLVPIPMLCMAIFTSVLQTLVFTILSSIYISGAIGHEH